MTREQELIREAEGKLVLVAGLLGLHDPRRVAIERAICSVRDAKEFKPGTTDKLNHLHD